MLAAVDTFDGLVAFPRTEHTEHNVVFIDPFDNCPLATVQF